MWAFLAPFLATPAGAMPLAEAVRLGLANNPDVQAAKVDIAAAETDVAIATNGYLPTLSVSGGPRSFSFDDVTYDVTAAQTVYDWGRTTSRVDGAKALKRQAAADALVRRDAAALDIVELYLDILLNEGLIETDRRHIERLELIHQMTQARASGGYSDKSEPERSGLELARARERMAEDEGRRRDVGNQFLLLVGEPATNLNTPSPDPLLASAMTRGFEAAVPDAPLYQKAIEDTRVAEATAREARAGQLPQLNLEASTLRRDLGGRAQSDTMVGVRFRMDTMQGLSSFQRARAAQQRVESARWREGVVARDISRDVRNMIDMLDLLVAREKTLLEQVDGSAALGHLYAEQFEVGRRDVIDLLNVQRETFEADRQAITVRIEQLRLHYRIAAKLGLIDRSLEGPEA
ncbi:TolC family protein [Allosphingosinicella vermicomposti]|uniref:TolC family protein n=1 Tax=Allosphingosinicella vermicomposti TaxID=614671 RepID=UPI0018F86DC9|nr:TolC family protein [Allosphingosinicella vermicomposti]